MWIGTQEQATRWECEQCGATGVVRYPGDLRVSLYQLMQAVLDAHGAARPACACNLTHLRIAPVLPEEG